MLTQHQPSPRRSAPGAVVGAFIALLGMCPAPARADSDPRREQARLLAAQGFEALQRKDYTAAEALFRQADALVPAPTLLVDHARSLVGLGKLVEGHEEFARVLREGVSADAPWPWKRAVSDAKAELAAVEPRLAWLTITVKGPPNPNVRIDGKPVPDAELGIRRATNPGVRRVSAGADRFLPVEREVTLGEGQVAQLELTLAPDENAPPLPRPQPPSPAIILIAAPPVHHSPDRTLAWVLVGAGGVGIATGVVTGLIALSARSDLERACGGRVCVPSNEAEYASYRAKVDRYSGFGTASGVALAVGVGASLGGAALFLIQRKQQTIDGPAGASHSTPRVALGVGLGNVEVIGGF